MTVMKVSCQCARIAALSTLAVFFGLLANRSQAATSYFFDVNGSTAGFGVTTGSTYDWDDPTNGGFWSTSSAGTVATNGWVQGGFPRIQPAGTPTYTITVSNDEQIAGIFFDSAQTLTINAIGSGDLNIVSGLQGVLGLSTADVTINAPITGPGEIQPSNGGNIRLNGINTYSGGTNLDSTSTLIHFSNGSSFGSGPINMGIAGLVPLLGSGGSPIALPNDFTSSVNNAGINFAADANTPVISNGAWSLGAFNLVLRNNGNSTSPLTLTNTISGSANITLSANNSGTIIFSGANTYTGTTAITGPGGAGGGSSIVRLQLGAPGTIASSSGVVLAGGTLDPGGNNQIMSTTTLALNTSTGPSAIDYGAGASEVDFANSSGVTWTGTVLNLLNWNPAVDKLRFGTDPTGLTAAQLATIEFNGSGLGTAGLDANGFVVVVPEPTTALLLLVGGLALGLRRRRAA
jgi:fibronectin-binding autotransporter adhesin